MYPFPHEIAYLGDDFATNVVVEEYDPSKQEQMKEMPDGSKIPMSEYHRLTAAAVATISDEPARIPSALIDAVNDVNAGRGLVPLPVEPGHSTDDDESTAQTPAPPQGGAPADTPTKPARAKYATVAKIASPSVAAAVAESVRGRPPTPGPLATGAKAKGETPAPSTLNHESPATTPTSAAATDNTSVSQAIGYTSDELRAYRAGATCVCPAGIHRPRHMIMLSDTGTETSSSESDCPQCQEQRAPTVVPPKLISTSPANVTTATDVTPRLPVLPRPDEPTNGEYPTFFGHGRELLAQLVQAQHESNLDLERESEKRKARCQELAQNARRARKQAEEARVIAKAKAEVDAAVLALTGSEPPKSDDSASEPSSGEWTTVRRRRRNINAAVTTPAVTEASATAAAVAKTPTAAATTIPAPRPANEFPALKQKTTVTRTTEMTRPSPHHEVVEVVDVDAGKWRRCVRAPGADRAAASEERKRRSERAPSTASARKSSRSSSDDDEFVISAHDGPRRSRQEQRERRTPLKTSTSSSSTSASTITTTRGKKMIFPRDAAAVLTRTVRGLANEFPRLQREPPVENDYCKTVIGAPISSATMISSARVQYVPRRVNCATSHGNGHSDETVRPEQLVDRRMELVPAVPLGELLNNIRPRSGTLLTAALDGAQIATIQTEKAALYNLRHRGLHDAASMFTEVAVRAKDTDREGLWLGLDTASIDPCRIRTHLMDIESPDGRTDNMQACYEVMFRVTYDSDVHILDAYNVATAERQIRKLAHVRRDFLRRQQSRMSPQRALQLQLLGYPLDDIEVECRRVRARERHELGEQKTAALTDPAAISYAKQLIHDMRRRNDTNRWD